MVREHTTEHTEIMDRIVTHIGLPSIPDWRRRGGAGSSPPNPGTRDPPGRARARRVYHADYPSSQRCTMGASDAPPWFPDHREGERRLPPSRAGAVARRDLGLAGRAERAR